MRGRSSLIAVVMGVVLAGAVGTASAGVANRLVIFGDSLSDTGNADIRFLGTVPGSGYFDGRFSNGPVWVERLAEQLLLPSPQPNLAGSGRWDYAFGGAMTVGSGFQSLFINDVDEQVTGFLNNDGGPIAGDLTVVWAGANDFFEGQTNAQVPVNNLANDITRLYNGGSRRFLVLNLPMLGQTPRYVGTANEAVFDARSTQFNEALGLALDGLEATLNGIELVRVDVGGLISSVIADPSAYGFTNVTDPAMRLAGIDPDTYLFWDDVHPTTAAHRMLGDVAAQALFTALSTLAGDLDFDGFVGIEDLNRVLGQWNQSVLEGNPLVGDPSGDGFVGIEDLNVVRGNWNAGTPAGEVANIPEPGVWACMNLIALLWIHSRSALSTSPLSA